MSFNNNRNVKLLKFAETANEFMILFTTGEGSEKSEKFWETIQTFSEENYTELRSIILKLKKNHQNMPVSPILLNIFLKLCEFFSIPHDYLRNYIEALNDGDLDHVFEYNKFGIFLPDELASKRFKKDHDINFFYINSNFLRKIYDEKQVYRLPILNVLSSIYPKVNRPSFDIDREKLICKDLVRDIHEMLFEKIISRDDKGVQKYLEMVSLFHYSNFFKNSKECLITDFDSDMKNIIDYYDHKKHAESYKKIFTAREDMKEYNNKKTIMKIIPMIPVCERRKEVYPYQNTEMEDISKEKKYIKAKISNQTHYFEITKPMTMNSKKLREFVEKDNKQFIETNSFSSLYILSWGCDLINNQTFFGLGRNFRLDQLSLLFDEMKWFDLEESFEQKMYTRIVSQIKSISSHDICSSSDFFDGFYEGENQYEIPATEYIK